MLLQSNNPTSVPSQPSSFPSFPTLAPTSSPTCKTIEYVFLEFDGEFENGDIIDVGCGNFSFNDQVHIDVNLTISVAGIHETVVTVMDVSGWSSRSIFEVTDGATLRMENLTISYDPTLGSERETLFEIDNGDTIILENVIISCFDIEYIVRMKEGRMEMYNVTIANVTTSKTMIDWTFCTSIDDCVFILDNVVIETSYSAVSIMEGDDGRIMGTEVKIQNCIGASNTLINLRAGTVAVIDNIYLNGNILAENLIRLDDGSTLNSIGSITMEDNIMSHEAIEITVTGINNMTVSSLIMISNNVTDSAGNLVSLEGSTITITNNLIVSDI